jgi:hypothetical protein
VVRIRVRVWRIGHGLLRALRRCVECANENDDRQQKNASKEGETAVHHKNSLIASMGGPISKGQRKSGLIHRRPTILGNLVSVFGALRLYNLRVVVS